MLALILPLAASAQEKTFEFYYISHDYSTNVNEICSMLEEKYQMAIEFSDCSQVFYLPDRENPKIVKMNLPGDNRRDFDALISELRGKYAHETYVYVDIEKIIEIINDADIIDEEGTPLYQSANFTWFVNPTFWDLNYNESLISSLYFILDLADYKDYVTFDIWNASDERIDVGRKPFGTKNLMGDVPFHLLIL